MVIDAAEALKRMMRNGMPDPAQLADIAAELEQYRAAVTGNAGSRLTIFGNMVVLLGDAGNMDAAVALEHHWNAVTRGLPFFTLCGYSAACFHTDGSDVWSRACAEHGAVSHAADLQADF
jgi:hypothetical protein